jgi:hypothetical protein
VCQLTVEHGVPTFTPVAYMCRIDPGSAAEAYMRLIGATGARGCASANRAASAPEDLFAVRLASAAGGGHGHQSALAERRQLAWAGRRAILTGIDAVSDLWGSAGRPSLSWTPQFPTRRPIDAFDQ